MKTVSKLFSAKLRLLCSKSAKKAVSCEIIEILTDVRGSEVSMDKHKFPVNSGAVLSFYCSKNNLSSHLLVPVAPFYQ